MPHRMLIPSIEQRLSHFMDLTEKATQQAEKEAKKKLTITISREFGCGGYPVAEKLQRILEERTGEPWSLMDKALIEEVAKDHGLLERVLAKLGEKSRVVDDIVSTLSPRWLTEGDYYRLLCRQIVALAAEGNVIIVGRGASIITQSFENCFHFRLFGSMKFKTEYISRRLSLSQEQADTLVHEKQRERDAFICDFLSCDAKDLKYYHIAFNSDKIPSDGIAKVIADYVVQK